MFLVLTESGYWIIINLSKTYFFGVSWKRFNYEKKAFLIFWEQIGNVSIFEEENG